MSKNPLKIGISREEAYDRLCAIAERLLKKHNPCGTCKACEYFGGTKSGCCKGCPFLGPTGCTQQCLACKLWLCWEAEGTGPFGFEPSDPRKARLLHQLGRLKRIAARNHFHYARATREEALAAKANHVPQFSLWHFYNQNRHP